MDILSAILVLGGLGLVLGLVLAFASKALAVEADSRLEELMSVLPGANCGGCGYAGCSAYVAALLDGTASAGGCPVGGTSVAESVAKIIGMEPVKNMRITALVRCSGGVKAGRKFEYQGISDCYAAMRIGGGALKCKYGCIGLGSCLSACPFGSISIVEGVAVVNHERCTGCLRCVAACPKGIITEVPYYADVNVACSSHARGAELRKVCEIGCLACKVCEKTCKQNAIRVVENLAVIDYSLCTGCGDCAEKCPHKLIVDAKLDKTGWVIEEE